MTETRLQSAGTGPLAPRGFSEFGTRPENLIMDAYAPAGGFVSTSADLGRYLSAILDGTEPGASATQPLIDDPDAARVGQITDYQVGLLWFTGRLGSHRVLLHTGETPGYRTAIVVDLDAGRAVAFLSNVNTPVGSRAQAALGAA